MQETSQQSPDWDFKKFEADMMKEFYHRKNMSFISNTINISKSKIMDQFLIIGAPPNHTSNKSFLSSSGSAAQPKILVAFPPLEQPNIPLSRVIENAFPTGMTREKLRKSSQSGFGSSLSIQDEFVFNFNVGTEKIYGVCIHSTCKLFGGNLPFFASKGTKKFTFCFCILTRVPIFNAHFTFLTYLVKLTGGAVQNSSSFNEPIAVSITGGDLIPDLDLSRHIGAYSSIKIPEIVENEITRYYLSSVDSKSLQLSKEYLINFPPSTFSYQQCLLCASVSTLFSLLSVSDIINTINALLLDAQVLIVGSSLQEISMTVLAFESLLKPFNYSGIVMPVLPTSDTFIDLLQSPTPFLFGVPPVSQLKKFQFLDSTIFVNLDKHTVPPVSYYPKYPDCDSVVFKILNLISLQTDESNPYCFPSEITESLNQKVKLSISTIDQIINEIHTPLNKILSDFLTVFFVTDTTDNLTIFNQELFLAAMDQKNLSFYEFLMDSQTFRDYVEKKLSEFTALKQQEIDIKRKSSFSGFNSDIKRRRSGTTKTKHFIYESGK